MKFDHTDVRNVLERASARFRGAARVGGGRGSRRRFCARSAPRSTAMWVEIRW